MRHCWVKIVSVFVFFMGQTALTGAALAKPRSTAALAKSQVMDPAPRKGVRQSLVRGPQGTRPPGAKVYRDPDTGEIREGTYEEAQALAGQDNGTPAPLAPLHQVTYSDGSVAVELDDNYLTGVVVERAADGTLRMRCGPAGERAPTPAPSSRPAGPPRIETE